VGNDSLLSGFTLTQGRDGYRGGGVRCELYGILSNCVLSKNIVTHGSGGGVYGGTLYNCVLTGNQVARTLEKGVGLVTQRSTIAC
jgi:hypothetical protein